MNVHLGLDLPTAHGPFRSKLAVVRGSYEYYHYGMGGVGDQVCNHFNVDFA